MKRTDDEFFTALCEVIESKGLWREAPYACLQLHPEDFKRLKPLGYGDTKEFAYRLRGLARSQADGSLVLARARNEFTFSVILWPGTTLPRNWLGVEVSETKIKRHRLFPPQVRAPKSTPERPSRFDREFEV